MEKPEICKQCTHENVPESGFPCHLCGYLVGADKSQIGAFKKKQTWGDKIRAMSDEELAEWLAGKLGCRHCDRIGLCSSVSECKEAYLQWLKSEVKE